MSISDVGQPTWYKPDNVLQVAMYLWNTDTLAWEKATGGGGVGTDVTVLNFPATQEVTASDLDIRALVFADDSVDVSGSAVSVTGTVTANAGTNLNTSALALEATLSTLNGKVTAVDTGAVVIASGSVAATQSGAWSTGRTWALSSGTDSVAVTGAVSVSGTVAISGDVNVTATDLDIRALISGTDSVAAVQSGVWNITDIVGTVSLPTGAATEATVALLATEATLAQLAIEPGSSSEDQTGPMLQAVTRDTPPSYDPGTIQPLTMTSEGRLRVSTVSADINNVWRGTFNNPWASHSNPWAQESHYV